MRIRPRCPGLFYGNMVLLMSTSNGYVKVVLSVLLLFAAVLVIAITVMETRSSWLRRDATQEQDSHHLARRKFSVAVATDVSNSELRYGVVIDCGSSGSRVYVYFWPPHNGNAKELLNIQHMRDKDGSQVLKKITPGLSTYEDKPSEASEYLRPLLRHAANHIPVHKHAETPLYIMATAGLRMLPESSQTAIMDDLRVDIPMEFRFMFVETHAEVISGKQEGVYAWIAINYVLGKFDHSLGPEDTLSVVEVPGQDHSTHFRKQTTGVLDMGGGSAQVAYEVPQSVRFVPGKEDIAKSLLAEFNLGCTASDFDHTYRVYVSTFLGFGANAARRRYEQYLVARMRSGVSKGSNNSTISWPGQSVLTAIPDPCLPMDMPEKAVLSGSKVYFRGTGDYELCLDKLKNLLNTSVPCAKEPCSMNGVYQPRLDFKSSEFYGFSEFFYTMEDILNIGGRYKYNKFHQAAKEYCGTKWSVLQEAFEKKRYPRADYNRYQYQCFKSAWMSLVLHNGFHFPKLYSSFTSVQLIDNKEVHWTLGALLYKTRYFPLTAIQQRFSKHHHTPWVLGQLQHSTYIIIVCFLVVGAAIFIYLRRLRIVRRPDLRKVPSMSYFMTEEGQLEDGITIRNVMT